MMSRLHLLLPTQILNYLWIITILLERLTIMVVGNSKVQPAYLIITLTIGLKKRLRQAKKVTKVKGRLPN